MKTKKTKKNARLSRKLETKINMKKNSTGKKFYLHSQEKKR